MKIKKIFVIMLSGMLILTHFNVFAQDGYTGSDLQVSGDATTTGTGAVVDAQNDANIQTGGIIETGTVTAIETGTQNNETQINPPEIPIPQAPSGLSGPQYGDIQIMEVFPSSGNCLDEFVKIQSHIEYHGYLSVYGLGTSTASVKVRIDLQTGSELIIADNLAGMLPNTAIMLVSSVTLTNGGEQLKLMIDNVTIDDVTYSNLQGTQSLFFTQLSGSMRLFTTNGPGTPPTNCSTAHSVNQLKLPAGLGLCDIGVSNLIYKGSGYYNLDLMLSGLLTTGCAEPGSKWIINNQEIIGSCSPSFDTQIGLNTIEYTYFSGDQPLCHDQFLFAANYDIGVIKQYVSGGGQCAASAQEMVVYPGSDCGIRVQSSLQGFFADYTFNIITTFNGRDITNGNHSYSCILDMGNGMVLRQCNPSSFEYKLPGIYPLTLEMIDKNGQLVCRTRSFVNAPLKPSKVSDTSSQLYELQNKVLNFCQTLSDSEDQTGEIYELCTYAQNPVLENSGISGNVLQDNETQSGDTEVNIGEIDNQNYDFIKLRSVLPNPKGSDSLLEEFSLRNQGEDEIDLKHLRLLVGKKYIALSGFVGSGGIISFTGGRGLRNDGMCIQLLHGTNELDSFCYAKVKEGELILRQGSGTIVHHNSTTSDNSKVELSCTEKIKIAKTKEQEKYKKLQASRKKDQLKYAIQIDKLKTKELIARNNRYLYENGQNAIFSSIKSSRPMLWEEGGFEIYKNYATELEAKIRSGYIYQDKILTKNGNRYKYTNDIKTYIKQQNEMPLEDLIIPGLSDYADYIDEYQMNKKSIEAVKRL